MPTHEQQATELYLIRHAETEMNVNPHLICGRSNDTLLTPRGVEQARRLGRAMLAKQIFPKQVFASPAVRAIDTARYSLVEMGLDIEPVIEDAIQELDQGPYQGKPRADIYTDTVLGNIAKLGKDFKLEGGESMNDVAMRLHEWVTSIFDGPKAAGPGRYFIYTHGGAIKYYASYLQGLGHRQTYETEIANASVNLFTGRNGMWAVEFLNRDAEAI